MKDIFNGSKMKYIDLYYNDLKSLELSLSEIKQIFWIKMGREIEYPN